MNLAIVSLSVPPFHYRSPWWWLVTGAEVDSPHSVDLVGPSGEHQFQKKTGTVGSAHLLNIFAEDNEGWSERERNEFVVKSHVYLSKLQRSGSFDRIVITDCAGAEPMLVGILSTLAGTWVKPPENLSSRRGELSYGLMELADHTFDPGTSSDRWPPNEEDGNQLIDQLTGEGTD